MVPSEEIWVHSISLDQTFEAVHHVKHVIPWTLVFLVSPVLNLCPPSAGPISKRPHSHFIKKVCKTVQLHQLSASKNVLRLFSAACV